MNKLELINTVLLSTLKADDKNLLIELIMRSDASGLSWPGVERLCKARGIKHAKNFKGAEVYLPGLVTVTKKGRKNFYVINTPAVAGLSEATVISKTTNNPALEGVNTPAVAANTPAVAENTPAVEGANSTQDNTKETKEDSSAASAVESKDIKTANLSLPMRNSVAATQPFISREERQAWILQSQIDAHMRAEERKMAGAGV